MEFKKDFVWGAATASFQIEGAAFEDGKAPSIWDAFCREPGRVFDGHNGDVACDHYHRYKEDVELMQEIGLKAYRFSISWPRILPEGTGKINQKGIEFYSGLIDALLAAGITPYITLYHWDYPLALYNKGGWLNPDSPLWFEEYTTVIAQHFGDRVQHFMTLNEPQIFMGLGYETIEHAPGIKMSRADVLRMNHNVLLSHGRAVRVLRNHVPDCKIGVAFAGLSYIPASDSKEDSKAAQLANNYVDKNNFTRSTGWWADPMILGEYPKEAEREMQSDMPAYTEEDMALISSPIDFFGINIYSSDQVVADPEYGFKRVPHKVGHRKTAIGWPVTPKSLYWFPKFMYQRYQLPIYITENGLSCTDGISPDRKVHDSARIDYLNSYLYNLRKAQQEGVMIEGFFQWSLLDNFEWAKGYSDRFGLIYVDYQSLERTLKDSAYWYRDVIKTNGKTVKEYIG